MSTETTTPSGSTESSSGDAHHAPGDFAHPSPPRTLLATFGALVVLTILTVVLAMAFEMGRFEVWVSLAIATVKATLVVCFFMHMLHDKPFNAMFFLGSILFVVLFIGITLMDTDQYKEDVQQMPVEELPEPKVGDPTFGDFFGT